METRKCTTCKEEQELSEFRKDRSRKDGIHPTCNTCNKKIQRTWYQNNKKKAQNEAKKRHAENKDQINSKRRQQRKDNPEKYREESKAYNKANPHIARESSWRRAGIKDMTVVRYNQMFEDQKGLCALCERPQEQFKRRFAIDHNHDTGKARGLLCDRCNTGLGKMNDSINQLEKAIKYLKQYE